jgi:hypothetical protein
MEGMLLSLRVCVSSRVNFEHSVLWDFDVKMLKYTGYLQESNFSE